MWEQVFTALRSWFSAASPQRADFESVMEMHQKLSDRLHNELVDRDKRIDALEANEEKLATQLKDMRKELSRVSDAQDDCERERGKAATRIAELLQENERLRNKT